ncbi:MAG: hypothetical protein K5888_06690 [Lachnospiraceae bacterium]|nr:hypothetical protein [Lachnospiraceae bacterium]
MPKTLIFVLIIFIAIVYIYTFLKWRKNRKKHSRSDIDEFKAKYLNKKERTKYINTEDKDEPEDLRIDYIDKNEFYRSVQDEIRNSKNNKEDDRKFTLKF